MSSGSGQKDDQDPFSAMMDQLALATDVSEQIHRRVSTVKQGNVAQIAVNESDVINQADAEQFSAVQPVDLCERVSEAPSYMEESKQGSVKTVRQVAAEMSFSESMVGAGDGGRPSNLNDAQLFDEYGDESESDDDEEEAGEFCTQVSGTGLTSQHSLKSSSIVDMEKPVTVQVTFQGSLVPVSKKHQVISSHPSMVKTRSGRVFKGGAADNTPASNRMATQIQVEQDDKEEEDRGSFFEALLKVDQIRQPSTSERVHQRERFLTMQDNSSSNNEHSLFKMLNRHAYNIASTIEQFEELRIDRMSFTDLKMMLEARREFSSMRDLNTSNIHSTSKVMMQGANYKSGDLRLVFMLSDAFDRFKGVDQEVVYDSANDDLIVSSGSENARAAARTSIKDEILRISSERFLRSCFKEEFLELSCMLLRSDEEQPQKINALMQSTLSYDDVKQEGNDGGLQAEERKYSVASRPSKHRRMTITQAQQLQISVSDTDPSVGSPHENGNSNDNENEPGSPIFHNAIIFTNQIQLNRIQRDRRGGMRRAQTIEAQENNQDHLEMFEMLEKPQQENHSRRKTVFQSKQAALIASMDQPSLNKPAPPVSYPARYNSGIAADGGEVVVQIHLVMPKDNSGTQENSEAVQVQPTGFSLRFGINTILTVEKEQLPIVQVFQTTRTLAIQTEIDEPVKKITLMTEDSFKELVQKFKPLNDQMVDLAHSIIPAEDSIGAQGRPLIESSDLSRSQRQPSENSILSESMQRALQRCSESLINDDQNVHIFECYKEMKGGIQLFGGGGFFKYSMVIEVIEGWDLWQVTLISQQAFQANKMPEEVFLLENVEQILMGPDRKMAEQATNTGRGMLSRMTYMGGGAGVGQQQDLKPEKFYTIFCLKTAAKRDIQIQTVYVVLPNEAERERFCQTISMIQSRSLKTNYRQFITQSLTSQPAPSYLKLQSRFYRYLYCAKYQILQRMLDYMRKTQTRPDQNETQKQALKEDISSATWITTLWAKGVNKTCTPRLEFKVVLFWNGKQKNCLIHAEPVLTEDGHFLKRYVTFRIIREEEDPRTHHTEEIFTREQVTRMNLSMSDNRLIKLNLIKGELIDVKLIFESVHKKHQFAELLNLTGEAKEENKTASTQKQTASPDSQQNEESKLRVTRDLKFFSITWNMGGKNQKAFMRTGDLIKQVKQYDVVAICVQECPRKLKTKRASEIEIYMTASGFITISNEFLEMYEMFLLCFIKSDLFEETANVSVTKIAKGMMNYIGNKGCIAYNFTLQNRHFNIIATHLRHGQNNEKLRDQMASELINELRLQHIQGQLPGLECDQSSDFCIFMGDMNYRMNTTFDKFNNDNVASDALEMLPTFDQLTLSLKAGNYPGYREAPINFLPSYKLHKSALLYIDKKNQSPSYCDRIIYKNNTELEVVVDRYECLHEIHGSDHRPVCLSLTIKDFGHPQYYELPKMLEAKQGFGLLDFEFLIIESLNLYNIMPLTQRVNPEMAQDNLVLRLSFYDAALDTETCPVIYSAEREISSQEMIQQESHQLTWTAEEMPTLITAYNTERLACQSSLLLLVWGKFMDGKLANEFLLGQARIHLSDLGKYRGDDGQAFSFGLTSLCMSNKAVGTVHSKIKFSTMYAK